MIDLHSHLLPGIDDGPSTMAEALEMARVAVAAGITEMACTPHMSRHYPTPVQWMSEAVDELRTALATAGIPLRIHPGGEIRLDWFGELDDEALIAASLGGTGRWILLEMPFEGWPLELGSILDGLAVRGVGAVLAHPERCAAVQRGPDRLWDLVGRGALLQINAGSLTGEHGPGPQRTARTLIASGLCHLLASDGHSADWRPPVMRPGLDQAAMVLGREPDEIHDLVQDTPAKILAGDKVSPSPRTPPRVHPERASRDSPGAP